MNSRTALIILTLTATSAAVVSAGIAKQRIIHKTILPAVAFNSQQSSRARIVNGKTFYLDDAPVGWTNVSGSYVGPHFLGWKVKGATGIFVLKTPPAIDKQQWDMVKVDYDAFKRASPKGKIPDSLTKRMNGQSFTSPIFAVRSDAMRVAITTEGWMVFDHGMPTANKQP